MKKNDTKGLTQEIKNTIYILKLVYQACPRRAILSVVKDTLGSCRWAIYNVVFLRLLLNALSTEADFRYIHTLLGIFAVVFIALQIFFVYYKRVIVPETDYLLTQNVNVMLYEKASSMDLAAYEDPDFYEQYTRALSGARGNVVTTFGRVSILISMICSSTIIFLNTAALDMGALLFIIIPILATFTIGNMIKKMRYDSDMENMTETRKIDYVKRVAYYKEYANEVRTQGIFRVLMRDYNKAIDTKISNTEKYGKKIAFYSLLNDNLKYVCLTFGVVLYLLVRLIAYQEIDIGDFIVMVNSVAILANNLIGISRQIISSSENNQYIDNFRKFMERKPCVVSMGTRKIDDSGKLDFTFDHVSFSYDGRKETLKDVSFRLEKNKIYAIVGYNCAGKTTLIKLLLRLYDPEEGRILLNGTDIREYDLVSYRGIFGVCFQDYRVFAALLSENILMRRYDAADRKLVENALKFSGLEAFVEKTGRVVTKEFQEDGLVFSEGQKQRLSIARAYAKNAPVFVLDEPTSALDPIAENDLYEKIEEFCGDRTVIFITHHLGSCMSADRIFYMADGKLVEDGTFQELMDNKSYFHDLFLKQKGGYTDEAAV